MIRNLSSPGDWKEQRAKVEDPQLPWPAAAYRSRFWQYVGLTERRTLKGIVVKLIRVGEPGREKVAVLGQKNELFDVPDSFGDIDGEFWRQGRINELSRLLQHEELAPITEEPLRFGAPIPKPEKVICIGLNFADHAKETGSEFPKEPIIFMKAPNTIIGPNDSILIPRGSTKTDWEVELAVVISKQARYLDSPEDSASVIGGFCISNDVSERDYQFERGGQWDKGKCCETFNPLGPWLVTPDEIADPQKLTMELSINGVSRQSGTTRDMIFGVDHIVWYLSQFMVLEPGDLINTGTPAGVSLGHDNVPYLCDGDVVETSIEGLGTQRNVVGRA